MHQQLRAKQGATVAGLGEAGLQAKRGDEAGVGAGRGTASSPGGGASGGKKERKIYVSQ
jgi:hypothetical protein